MKDQTNTQSVQLNHQTLGTVEFATSLEDAIRYLTASRIELLKGAGEAKTTEEFLAVATDLKQVIEQMVIEFDALNIKGNRALDRLEDKLLSEQAQPEAEEEWYPIKTAKHGYRAKA